MPGSVHYPEAPDVSSRRRPIAGDRHRVYESVSEPVSSTRSSKSSIVLGTVLGIGAGVLLFALIRAAASGSEVTLNETPPVPVREPAFTINPGYQSALAIPAGKVVTSSDEAQHASVTPSSTGSSPDAAPTPLGATPSDSSELYDERENVSGSESPTGTGRPIDTLGRETNVGVRDLDVGDIDVQGPAGASREQEQKERMDMAPTETAPKDELPGGGTERDLPSMDRAGHPE